MLENIKIVEPMNIEKSSFDIITKELDNMGLKYYSDNKYKELELNIIKRVIHTTADFDYFNNIYISNNAIESALNVLKSKCSIFTDTTMAMSGINKRILSSLNCNIKCFISDEYVISESRRRNLTRSALAVEKASKDKDIKIYVVGNAPTALIAIFEAIKNGYIKNPALIIGVPVGFVNVVESKELFINNDMNIPCIIARGRKGGSNVAAAILNAILYTISEDRRE